MKVKEYFNQWVENKRSAESLAEIVTLLIKELKQIIDNRHIQTDDGLYGAVRELYQKWCSFCEMSYLGKKMSDEGKQKFRAIFPITLVDVYPALKPG